MQNNLYQWHDEHMVRHEMREIDHAVEQARLLREAGLSNEGWLARVLSSLGNLLTARRNGLRGSRSIETGVSSKRSAGSA
jgi:hypothetical protein